MEPAWGFFSPPLCALPLHVLSLSKLINKLLKCFKENYKGTIHIQFTLIRKVPRKTVITRTNSKEMKLLKEKQQVKKLKYQF